MNLYDLPPSAPFLDSVASGWLALSEDRMAVSQGLILLPTRRAARALADAFLRVSAGQALLLPRIVALGAFDETPLALAGALDLPPAVGSMPRLAALTRMILEMRGADGAPRTADRAWRLAEALAALMDEAERAEIDLAAALPQAADPDYAEHWTRTLDFLRIVTAAWPAWLACNGVMNPAARQVALLDAQATAWERTPPRHRVLLAGASGGFPAIGRLASVIARLHTGAVLLPGLDLELAEEIWERLDESHYQAGLRHLLEAVGATRVDVRRWPWCHDETVPSSRSTLLRRALLPGYALTDWQNPAPVQLADLFRLAPADQQEEAAAIALVLREALQTQAARAALVTPDRELAERVVAELGRFGVVADDSAGERLADTPPAVLVRLLAHALAEDLAPVSLLALLKHPLAAAGLSPRACRAGARALELACLRGPRPSPGLSGLRRALDRRDSPPCAEAAEFLVHLEEVLQPALRIAGSVPVAPAEAMAGLIAAAERLAATDCEPGAVRLWSGEVGEALAERLAGAYAALPGLPDQPRTVLPGLLDAMLDGVVVRSRRALRGRDGVEHPRIFVWGLLEARLQSVDVMVLGGLAEGVWPAAVDPGPWLSRPMRRRVGLPSPEELVGQAAHDFACCVCGAPRVVLSCPQRRDGAPTVPARWLTRLEMFLSGRGVALPHHPAVGWVRALDQPPHGPKPVPPPLPCPAVSRRPRHLSVTEVETWLRDPYAIYARHILRLKPLDPLDEETDAADYGSLVHTGLRRFLEENGARWPPGAAAQLRAHLLGAMPRRGLNEALQNWWAPRLVRIADWVSEIEATRRSEAPLEAVWAEVSGRWEICRPGGPFALVAKADRIERRTDGSLAILDYKTGQPPTGKEVAAGLAPQLPLEAAMAAAGAFGPQMQARIAELCYWHVTGGYVPGQVVPLFRGKPDELAACVTEAKQKLEALIDAFDDPARFYLSHPHPARAPRFSDYAQLARLGEWVAAGEPA